MRPGGVTRGIARRRGATVIEATLVLVCLFALIFLLMDFSWAVFAKATLQHAVRAGVRYAVTSQAATDTSGKPMGQMASIEQVVQNESMGLLADTSLVNVNYYTIGGASPVACSGAGCNIGGNLVVVCVGTPATASSAQTGYQLAPMAPLLRSSTPVMITVCAGDVMEASPIGGPPQM